MDMCRVSGATHRQHNNNRKAMSIAFCMLSVVNVKLKTSQAHGDVQKLMQHRYNATPVDEV